LSQSARGGDVSIAHGLKIRAQKHNGRWQKGQSGNPAGRPKGSRNQFGEEFVSALRADFAEHGLEVLERVRRETPSQYLRVRATVVPKEFHLKNESINEMNKEELDDLIARIKLLLAMHDQQVIDATATELVLLGPTNADGVG
jgi:hypothetical protein